MPGRNTPTTSPSTSSCPSARRRRRHRGAHPRDYFQQNYNITINVVNKPGGAQAIGINEMLRARPDGYTFGFPAIATFSTTPQIKKTGYTLADFRAVVQVTNMWLSLAVNADSGIKTINELMAAARRTPASTIMPPTEPSLRSACS